MGTFVISVKGVGNHGCQREIKDGGIVEGCGAPGCVDCAARKMVDELKRMGCSFDEGQGNHAVLTHWPGDPGTVIDNLITGVRRGSF